MNQIVQMIMKSNARMESILNDGADLSKMNYARKEAEFQLKSLQLVLNSFTIESKNRRAMAKLERMNVMDDTTAIDLLLGDPGSDMVKCPLRDNLITREHCLDYSGSNGDDCRNCETGKATRTKLLGERAERGGM